MSSYETTIRWCYSLGFLWPCGLLIFLCDFILLMMAASSIRFDLRGALIGFCLIIFGLLVTLSPFVFGFIIQQGKHLNSWLLHTSNSLAIGLFCLINYDKPIPSIDEVSWGFIIYVAAFFILGYWLNIINKQHLPENLK